MIDSNHLQDSHIDISWGLNFQMPILLTQVNRIYWTRQHGAYITLITSWIIAVIVTGFSLLQIPAIIFLLSSVNLTELITEKMTRKSPVPDYKKVWMNIYGAVTFISGNLLLMFSHSFRDLILFLAAGALIFIVLARNKFQKSLPAEMLTFALFVVSAFTGSVIGQWSEILLPVIIMVLFFGTSVFAVKQRFERINISAVISYTVIAIIITLLLTGFSGFGIGVSLLMIAKTSPSWAFQKQFKVLQIKQVGMLEGIFQLLLIVLFFVLY